MSTRTLPRVMRWALTLASSNRKTGPMPVATGSAATCPPSCPFLKICYAAGGHTGMHWRKVTAGARGLPWGKFVRAVGRIPRGSLWRYAVAGDLPGVGDRIDARALAQLVIANVGRRGFTYTHKPATAANLAAVRAANAGGFVVNLSANNPTHADELAATGAGPVAVVLPKSAGKRKRETRAAYRERSAGLKTPAGRRIVVCPATYRAGVTCASCGLCAVAKRGAIIGFPAHGATWRAVETAAGYTPAG